MIPSSFDLDPPSFGAFDVQSELRQVYHGSTRRCLTFNYLYPLGDDDAGEYLVPAIFGGFGSRLSYTADYLPIGEKDGVHLLGFTDTETQSDAELTFRGYGGWLKYTAFAAGIADVETGRFRGRQLVLGQAIGHTNDSGPAGDATWRGLMVGVTEIEDRVYENVHGTTLVTYSLERNRVDLAFSDICAVETENSYPDLEFPDLPVWPGEHVSFAALHVPGENPGDEWGVLGYFYGPGHAEVGGVFDVTKNGLYTGGAFGAKTVD